MLMLLFTLVVVGVTAYIWCIRGFFSALVHMVCVIAAGAVAFGVWEPVSYFILDGAPERGFGSFLQDMAFGLGLAIPFAVTLAILRGIVDKILPANAQCEPVADYVGGVVCGFISGVISGGIMVLSIGMLRLAPDSGAEYQAVNYTSGPGRGSIERTTEMFIPWADRVTASLYGHLSLTSFRTDEPLARWQPDLDTFPSSLRMAFEGKDRITLRPDAFKVVNWYVVGDQAKGQKFDGLLTDAWNEVPQKVSNLSGKQFGIDDEPVDLRTGYLGGFIVKFNTKAREKAGQVVVGNAQVRLVCVSDADDDESIALHPIAIVTNVDDPTKIAYARFAIKGDNIFTSSVGGAGDCVMAFEFPIPAGFHPLAIYVKGVRVNRQDPDTDFGKLVFPREPVRKFADPADRDEAIKGGEMEGMTDVGPILDANGKPVQAQGNQQTSAPLFNASNRLGFVFQKGQEQSLDLQQETRGYSITSGEQTFDSKQIGAVAQVVDFKLRVDRFSTTPDTAVVQICLTPRDRDAAFNKTIESADRNAQPVLVDSNGTRYPAVGWVYKDSGRWKVRYDKQHPIEHISELPAISRSTPDKELQLLFVVSVGVEITDFKVGEDTLGSPPKGKLKIEAVRSR